MLQLNKWLLLACVVPAWLGVAAGEEAPPGCLVTIPAAEAGPGAYIPVLFDFPAKKFLTENRVDFRVAHEADALVFDAVIPLHGGYRPTGLDERDGPIWNDDRIEVFLQPGGEGSFYQFIVNAVGAVYDSKDKDPSWNSEPERQVTLAGDHWQVRLRIPYALIGFDPAGGAPLKGNVAVCSNEPGHSYLLCWAPMKIDFLRIEAFGTMKPDGGDAPAVTAMRLGELRPDPAAGAELPVTFEVGGTEVEKEFALSGSTTVGTARIRYRDDFAYDLELYNRFRPDIELVALDTERFFINLRNADALRPLAQRFELRVDGRPELNAPIDELARNVIDTSGWEEGEHRFEYRLLTDDGALFAAIEDRVCSIGFAPAKFDIAELDASRYFKPMTYEPGKLTVARSEFDLTNGILPEQIAVDGRPILETPLRIEFDGKVLKTDGPVRLVSANRNRVVLASETVDGDKRLAITATCDFDGFVWYDVTLKSSGRFEYAPLAVTLPTRLDSDILLSYGGRYPDRLFSKSGVEYTLAATDLVPEDYTDTSLKANSELLETEERRDVALSSFVGVATDTGGRYRGVGLVSEGPRGWNLSDYDKSYAVVRKGPLATLTMNVSDGKTRFPVDEIAFSFGVMPYPLRRIADEFHRDLRLDCSHGFYAAEGVFPDGRNFLQTAAAQGLKNHVLFENWTSAQNYWEALDNEPRVRNYLAKAKEAGIGVYFYFGFLLSNTTPGFKIYHDLLFRNPTNYPNPGFRPYVYYHMGDPDQDSWVVCYASPWGDRYAEGVGAAIRNYGLKGVYFDGAIIAGGCANTKHGCGTIDPYGRKIVTIPVRKYRRLTQMIYHAGVQARPDFEMDLHTPTPTPLDLGLLAGYYTREDSNLFDPSALTSPKSLRGIFNGRLFGVPCAALRRPECGVDALAAQVLLVDTFPRPGLGYGPPYLSRNPELWRLYEQYGLTADTFTPYWVAGDKVKPDNDAVFVSYYETPDVLILVVSAYWSKTPQPVALDLGAFGPLSPAVRDVWLNRDYRLTDGKIELEIPARNMRLLVIDRQKTGE